MATGEQVAGQTGDHALEPIQLDQQLGARRVAVGEQRAAHRLELVDREDRAELLELARGLRVGLQRLLEERLEVDVEQPDAVGVELADGVLVALLVRE